MIKRLIPGLIRTYCLRHHNAIVLSRSEEQSMSQLTQRSTVYFDPQMHKALRLKAAQENRSVSDIVNEAVALLASEDAEDIADFDSRRAEPTVDYASFVQKLKNDGTL